MINILYGVLIGVLVTRIYMERKEKKNGNQENR